MSGIYQTNTAKNSSAFVVRLASFLLFIGLVLLGVWGWFFVERSHQTSETTAYREAVDYHANVKRHMEVPDSMPLVAKIQDIDSLKANQLFFQDGQNGDIVLWYDDYAILYRPGEDIIINAGPVVE